MYLVNMSIHATLPSTLCINFKFKNINLKLKHSQSPKHYNNCIINFIADDYTHSVILHTNYVDWSLVYTCSVQQILGRRFRLEFASVYTRQPFIDDILDDFTKTLLTGLGFPPETHTHMNQEGCV